MEGALTDTKRQAAIAWASRGFRVFPLWPGTKVPVSEGWTEWATANPADVWQLWTDALSGWPRDYNIGVLTNDMIVVDADTKAGKRGVESFQALDLSQDTLVVRTPSGGYHFYYHGPNKSLSAGKLGNGIDIRSYHGYVIAPGSTLDPAIASNKGVGGDYSLLLDRPVAAAAAHLVARLDEPLERQDRTPVVALDQPAAILRAVQYLDGDAPVAVQDQAGDHTTFKVAATLKDIGVSQATAVQLLATHWNDRCIPPWSLEELQTKAENAFSYGTSSPGASSPAAYTTGLEGLVAPLAAPPPSPLERKWFTHGDPWRVAVPWAFYRVLPAVGVAMLTGPSGGGKTFVAMELARCLATGREFFGVAPDDVGATVFLFGGTEGSGFAARLAGLQEDKALPIAGTQIGLLAERGVLDQLEADIRFKADELLLTYGVPLRMVVLDTLSASGLLVDENDNAKAAMAMTQLSNLGLKLGVLMVVTHHPPKEGKGERGAGAIRASADYVLEVFREEKKPVRDIALTKARDAEERQLGHYTLTPVVLGQDGRGREVSTLTVTPSESHAQISLKRPQFSDVFMECVEMSLQDESDCALTEKGKGVEEEAVKALFKDRKSGSRDRSNINKTFKNAVDWAEGLALLSRIEVEGRTYIVPFVIN